jgi:hypothetical protein
MTNYLPGRPPSACLLGKRDAALALGTRTTTTTARLISRW